MQGGTQLATRAPVHCEKTTLRTIIKVTRHGAWAIIPASRLNRLRSGITANDHDGVEREPRFHVMFVHDVSHAVTGGPTCG